jgi:hypothetical protein
VGVAAPAGGTLRDKACGFGCSGTSNVPYSQLLSRRSGLAPSALSQRVSFCFVSYFLYEPVFTIHTCTDEVFLVSSVCCLATLVKSSRSRI